LTKEVPDESYSRRSLAGGYYWLPRPSRDLVEWEVLTCQDLGSGPEEGHFDLWPSVIDRLASIWHRDRRHLRRLLARHCYGLPRGRVTRPGRRFLLLHGHDAPVANWLDMVIERFDLDRQTLKPMFDEHETTFTQDRQVVYAELGLPVGRHRGEGGSSRC
jgi:hypothetical protein